MLYKWAPGWGLPSLSVACLQVEVSSIDDAWYCAMASRPFLSVTNLQAAQGANRAFKGSPADRQAFRMQLERGKPPQAAPQVWLATAAIPTPQLLVPALLTHLAHLHACWGPLAQAYLRLAKIPFAVQDCNAPSAAPTAQLPVLDAGADLVGAVCTKQGFPVCPGLLMLLLGLNGPQTDG